MYSTYTELLSLLLIIIYLYAKTRDRISLLITGYIFFLLTSGIVFRFLFPDVPFFSPTLEYTVFLIWVGIPFLVVLALIFYEVEKKRTQSTGEKSENISFIFEFSRDNIIFWTIIILMNLIAFLLEKGK
jgi:hypothetical protein